MELDKWLHFIAGYGIYLTFSFGIGHYALIPVVAAGVGKELYDAWHPEQHSVEVADAIATVAGGLTGWGLYEASRATGGTGYEIPVSIAGSGVLGMMAVQAFREQGRKPEAPAAGTTRDLRQLPGYGEIVRDASLNLTVQR